jgi:hypothetical protein
MFLSFVFFYVIDKPLSMAKLLAIKPGEWRKLLSFCIKGDREVCMFIVWKQLEIYAAFLYNVDCKVPMQIVNAALQFNPVECHVM